MVILIISNIIMIVIVLLLIKYVKEEKNRIASLIESNRRLYATILENNIKITKLKEENKNCECRKLKNQIDDLVNENKDCIQRYLKIHNEYTYYRMKCDDILPPVNEIPAGKFIKMVIEEEKNGKRIDI